MRHPPPDAPRLGRRIAASLLPRRATHSASRSRRARRYQSQTADPDDGAGLEPISFHYVDEAHQRANPNGYMCGPGHAKECGPLYVELNERYVVRRQANPPASSEGMTYAELIRPREKRRSPSHNRKRVVRRDGPARRRGPRKQGQQQRAVLRAVPVPGRGAGARWPRYTGSIKHHRRKGIDRLVNVNKCLPKRKTVSTAGRRGQSTCLSASPVS